MQLGSNLVVSVTAMEHSELFDGISPRSNMNRRELNRLITGAALGRVIFHGNGQIVPAPKDFKFSVMLWTLEKQASLERCIEIVAAAGYQGIELVGEFQTWSPEDTRKVMAQMRSLGLVFDAISGVKAGFAEPGQSSNFIGQLAEQIRAAKDLGCPQIILLSGNRVEDLPPGVQRLTSIENLKRAADLASKNDIEIVIEPIDPLENPAIFLTTVSDGIEIVQEVRSRNVKVLYDFYHEQRAIGNLIEKLEKHIEWIGLVHIADVPGRHEPGTGEINYAMIYRKLAELNYSKFIAMEYYPTGDMVVSLKRARLAAIQAWYTGTQPRSPNHPK
jgi:hydroxypyruvate isomerase